MNNKFDELAKGLAQSTTRRQALKKFGVGLAGIVLACFGLANRAQAGSPDCLECMHACRKLGYPTSYCGGVYCVPVCGNPNPHVG